MNIGYMILIVMLVLSVPGAMATGENTQEFAAENEKVLAEYVGDLNDDSQRLLSVATGPEPPEYGTSCGEIFCVEGLGNTGEYVEDMVNDAHDAAGQLGGNTYDHAVGVYGCAAGTDIGDVLTVGRCA